MAIRQMHVSDAKSPRGAKSSALGKCCAFTMMVVVLIFFVSLGGENQIENDNLRSGQAQGYHTSAKTSTEVQTVHNGMKPQDDDEEVDEEYKLESAVEDSENDLIYAEREELQREEEGILNKSVEAMDAQIRSDLTQLVGDDASEEEMNEMVEEVETSLRSEINQELESRAGILLQKEEDAIDEVYEDGEESGLSADEIEARVHKQEQQGLLHVREGIDDAAIDIKTNLRLRVFNNEKAIMEKKLSRLYGKPITLQAMDGNKIVPLAQQIPGYAPGMPMPAQGGTGYQGPTQTLPVGGYQQQQERPGATYQQGYQYAQQQQAPVDGYQRPQQPEVKYQQGYQQVQQQQAPVGWYQQPQPQGGYQQGYQQAQQQQVPAMGYQQQQPEDEQPEGVWEGDDDSPGDVQPHEGVWEGGSVPHQSRQEVWGDDAEAENEDSEGGNYYDEDDDEDEA